MKERCCINCKKKDNCIDACFIVKGSYDINRRDECFPCDDFFHVDHSEVELSQDDIVALFTKSGEVGGFDSRSDHEHFMYSVAKYIISEWGGEIPEDEAGPIFEERNGKFYFKAVVNKELMELINKVKS